MREWSILLDLSFTKKREVVPYVRVVTFQCLHLSFYLCEGFALGCVATKSSRPWIGVPYKAKNRPSDNKWGDGPLSPQEKPLSLYKFSSMGGISVYEKVT